MDDEAIQCMASELAGVMSLMLGPFTIKAADDNAIAVCCQGCETVVMVADGERGFMEVIEALKPHIHQHAIKLMSDMGMPPN